MRVLPKALQGKGVRFQLHHQLNQGLIHRGSGLAGPFTFACCTQTITAWGGVFLLEFLLWRVGWQLL